MASGGVTVAVLMLLNTFDKNLRNTFKKENRGVADQDME
jgi:hypothetical protein